MSNTNRPGLSCFLLPRIQRPGLGLGFVLVPDELSIGLMLGLSEPRAVTQEDLDGWDMSLDDALEIALENLRRNTSDKDWQPIHTVPGMYAYLACDSTAAARALILTELLDPWPFEGVLVCVPAPDQLLIVPLESVDSLQAMRVMLMAGQAAQRLGNDPLSDQVYWYDGEAWFHIEVEHDTETVEVNPPPEFVAALERLSAYNMVAVAGEA